MTALPLLSVRDLSAALAWRHGQPISGAQFVAEALWLAETLPASGRPINLCQDRYFFALGLAAALLRGHTSLLPPNALPDTLRQVPAGAAPYLLLDDGDSTPAADGLLRVAVRRPPGVRPVFDVPVVDAGFDAVCLLTSGSTGAPQPHARRWPALVANIAAQAERLAGHLQQPSLAGLALVATVPAQHSYGLESSVLLALLGGASFEAGRPFYPADIAAALASVPVPRALVTTPFHLKTLLRAGLAPLPSAALLLSATAPLSPQLAAQAEQALQGQLIEIYGCTEAGQVASRRTTAGDQWTTLGALRISSGSGSPEADAPCTVSGGHVAEPTPLADVLQLDSPQHFRLLGRANDLIHVAGKRSSLAHLNFQLNRIEGVEDGAFWLPAEDGETVARTVAFVVAPQLGASQITAALRVAVEGAFVPRRVVHVTALPREATGKLTAAALRSFALAVLADPVVTIACDHPAFAGHFPGRPIVPGVVLLSLVTDALQGRLGAAPSIDSAKFLAPVGPGAQLRVALRPQAGGMAFEVWRGPGHPVLAVRGTLSPGSTGSTRSTGTSG